MMQRIDLTYRLIMPSSLWAGAFGELSQRRSFAFGRLRASYHGNTCDWIVDRMRFIDHPPSGVEFSQLDDWLLMVGDRNADPETARQLLKASGLRPGQRVVLLQPGLGADRSGWLGFVADHTRVLPLHEIHLVGPGMRVFRRFGQSPSSSQHSSDDRWSRQRGALGEQVFTRFCPMHAMVIGGGRLGSLIAEGLVRSGIRRLTNVDPDNLEEHNLNATVGARLRDVGKPKVNILLRYLHAIHPDTILSGLQRSVEHPDVYEAARPVDLIISCLDNDAARRHVSTKIAIPLIKVHLDLGTIVRRPDPATDAMDYAREIGADIRMLLPGTCVDCVDARGFPEPVTDEPQFGLPEWQRGGRTGSLISINYIAAGCAIQMIFDLLANRFRGSYWQRLRWNQGTGIESTAGHVVSRGNCEVCGR
jgi:hypothetical protein